MKHLKLIIATLSLVSTLSMSGAAANGLSSSHSLPPTDIVADSFVGTACSALTNATDTTCANGSDSFKGIASTVVSLLSYIIGIVSVIVIIIAGFRYVIAGGDSNAVNSAKNTLIYAIVGLVIAVLAQFLVHTVLNTANSIQQKSSYLNSLTNKTDS